MRQMSWDEVDSSSVRAAVTAVLALGMMCGTTPAKADYELDGITVTATVYNGGSGGVGQGGGWGGANSPTQGTAGQAWSYWTPEDSDCVISYGTTIKFLTGCARVPQSHNATNKPQNSEPATCRSSPDQRASHAQQDAAFTQAERIAARQPLMHPGDIITVEYDDGGTERWAIANPLTSSILAPQPQYNSLECPGQSGSN